MYRKLCDMFKVVNGQLLVAAVRIPSPTTKYATMVRALLINSVEFVKKVCRLRKNLLINQNFQSCKIMFSGPQ